jgi:putative toxin-antitoxin system antitoxin component (TIGR02293 family)
VKTCSNLEMYIGISPNSYLELAQLIERGLPTKNLDFLREQGLTGKEIAATVISPRALRRREVRGKALTRQESERAVRMVFIVREAEMAFGTLEGAMRWLRQTDDRLRCRTPLSMLRTEPGGRLVESILKQTHA